MKKLLLLFTPQLLCWDEETVKLAGENPDGLKPLEADGDIVRLGKAYTLTEKGIRSREAVSQENFVPVEKISRLITDIDEANERLELSSMTQYLDNAFMTDWGIKEITINESFPIIPCLEDDQYFRLENNHAKALWQDLKIIESFKKFFPNYDYDSRRLPAPGQRKLDEWAKINNAPEGVLRVDFVLRNHHDFEHYRKLKTPDSDIFRFVNAGLLIAHKVNGDFESLLPFIGKIHIFFMMQRRVYIPGWFDMDSEEQEPAKFLTFVTDTDSELEKLTKTLRQWGHDLIAPANPMFIIGTSIEHMRGQKAPKRMICEWFEEETVKILRPDDLY